MHAKRSMDPNQQSQSNLPMRSHTGIPDFRSPGGMYDTLKPELLTATPEQRESIWSFAHSLSVSTPMVLMRE